MRQLVQEGGRHVEFEELIQNTQPLLRFERRNRFINQTVNKLKLFKVCVL